MCDSCGEDRGLRVIDHSITHPFDLAPASDMDCAVCGQHLSRHPDKMDWLVRRQTANILDHGHQVILVGGGEDSPAFAYSVGRSLFDKPELLVVGDLPQAVLGHMVNRVAELADERGGLQNGDLLDEVLEDYPVRVVEVTDLQGANMTMVIQKFGREKTSAFQILWPDEAGCFPDNPAFGYPEGTQPVFP